MPPTARKATPEKPNPVTPGEAAVAEALDDGDVALDFRGERFVVTAETRRSFRYAMAVASGNTHQMIYEMISPVDRPRFILTAEPGEAFGDVAAEFTDAFDKASGQGNS